MKKLILIALLLSGLNTYAGEGNDGGGGNAVGTELFDFYEDRGTTKFNVAESKAYKEILLPTFNFIDTKIIGLTDRLKRGLSERWVMEPKPLTGKQCINTSVISANKQIVACQNNLEIRVSKNWYNNTSLRNQAGLILHELVRFHIPSATDEEIRFATRMLFIAKQLSQAELEKISYLLGNYEMMENYNYAKEFYRTTLYPKYCTNPNLTWKDSIGFVKEGFNATMDLRHSSSQQSSILKRASEVRKVHTHEMIDHNYDVLKVICEKSLQDFK